MEFESPFKFPDIMDRINESAVVFNGNTVTKYKEFGPEDLKNPVNVEVYEESAAYNYINEAFIKRSEVDSKDFGLPEKKKYPMPDEKHVRSAIKFFNYVDKADEEELARNIKKKIKQYKITDISVGKRNRFNKYYKSEEKKKAVNEYYHGEENSHMEFESVLFGDGEIVEEGKISNTFKSIIESIKKAIVNLIDKINGWLDKHPDSKVAQKVKEILTSLKGLLTKADNIKSKEDVEDIKARKEKAEEEFEKVVASMDYDYFEAVITTDTIRKELKKLPTKEGFIKIALVKDFGKLDKNGVRNIHPYVSISVGYGKGENDLTEHVKTVKIGYKQLAKVIDNLLSKDDDREIVITD